MVLRKLRDEDASGMLEWMHDKDIQKSFSLLQLIEQWKICLNLYIPLLMLWSMARVFIMQLPKMEENI